MLNLIKKEILLSMHPTAFIFLAFAALIFIPAYPYEIIFFFSTLSFFCTCLASRENDDIAFTCGLPVKKSAIPLARILTTAGSQCILLLLIGILGAIKSSVMPQNMQINPAGLSANMALVGTGALILGVFNAVFLPLYYNNPEKVGVPYFISAVFTALTIGVLIILRWTTPLFSEILNGSNAENTGYKALAMIIGLVAYAVLTSAAAVISVKRFRRVDL